MKTIDLNIDNATLVQECRSGDQDAMSVLYTRFAPRMLRVISRYVPDRDSAQDILHDGFIAAFTRLDTLRDPECLDFWLATIMKNLSLKFLQAQSISSILEEIPETIDEADPIETLDFATLESLIRQLPEGYQKVFRLAVLEGKSHKEISEILGIAPNSSSSQLFHAKLRLRQLIRDHQLRAGLISLLLLIASSGILFLSRNSEISPPNDKFAADKRQEKHIFEPILKADSISRVTNNHAPSTSVASIPTYAHIVPSPVLNQESNTCDATPSSFPGISDADIASIESDSVSIASPSEQQSTLPLTPVEDNKVSFYDRLIVDTTPRNVSADKGWSAGFSVDPGLLSFNSIGGSDLADSHPWHDPENPPSDSEDEASNSSVPFKAPIRKTNDIESYLGSASRRHHLPISFALTAEKHFFPWIALESGIGYSYLQTDFERYNLAEHKNEVATCHWHYLEIPLKVNLYAYTSPRFKLYASLGGRVAVPVYSYASIPSNPYCQSGGFGSKVVWSVGGSVGAAFRLSKRVDLFIEPSLRYHFPQECTLPNIWTDDEPFSLSLPIGLRLSW